VPEYENAAGLTAAVAGPGLRSVSRVLRGRDGSEAEIAARGGIESRAGLVRVQTDGSCGASRPKPARVCVYIHSELTIITAGHKYSAENNALGSRL